MCDKRVIKATVASTGRSAPERDASRFGPPHLGQLLRIVLADRCIILRAKE